jgi:dTMP kinase
LKKGYFITFEGVEGSGKSTLIRWLCTELTEKGYNVITCREPGGDSAGQAIRELLLDRRYNLTDEAELLLMEAARSQNVSSIIKPAIDEGKLVLCDRYTDSTIAYQGNARGLDFELIKKLNTFATGGLTPDLTIVLDLPVEAGLNRTAHVDRISTESYDFHQKVREKYLEIAKNNPGRVMLFDAGRSLDEIKTELLRLVINKLGEDI